MSIPSFLQPAHELTVSTSTPAHAAASLAGVASASGSLSGFSMQMQQQDNWCWAAVSTSVAEFFGSTAWTQCTIAAAELGLDCCGGDAAAGCNIPWYLDRVLSRVGYFDRMISSNSPFSAVVTEVAAGRPLCCRIAWANSTTAHFMTLAGWSTDENGTEYVEVDDPIFGPTHITYQDFKSAYRQPGDAWTHSYFTRTGGMSVAGGASLDPNSPKGA